MGDPALDCLREAGRIAASARRHGARLIVAGARVAEVCEAVEDEIRRRRGGLAFPVQSSRNAVAAHDCPPPGSDACYQSGDLAKLDVGVHVDGWVVDTAISVSVGDSADGRALVAAATAALEAGIAAMGPGVRVRGVTAAIEKAIRSAGFRPMRNLCGHGVGRWTVHGPPPVPNELMPTEPDAELTPGSVVAVEPFVTAGSGVIRESGPPEVFRLDPTRLCDGDGLDGRVLEALEGLRGLPFARRHFKGLPALEVERALASFGASGALQGYPPLAEAGGFPVAQAEHTIRIGEDGIEVLTR